MLPSQLLLQLSLPSQSEFAQLLLLLLARHCAAWTAYPGARAPRALPGGPPHPRSALRGHSAGTSTRTPAPAVAPPPPHAASRGHGRIAAWSASSSTLRVVSWPLPTLPTCECERPHTTPRARCGCCGSEQYGSCVFRMGADASLPLPYSVGQTPLAMDAPSRLWRRNAWQPTSCGPGVYDGVVSVPVAWPQKDAPGAVDDIGEADGAPVATESSIGSPYATAWLWTVDVERGGFRGDGGAFGRPRASGGSGGRGRRSLGAELPGAPVATRERVLPRDGRNETSQAPLLPEGWDPLPAVSILEEGTGEAGGKVW